MIQDEAFWEEGLGSTTTKRKGRIILSYLLKTLRGKRESEPFADEADDRKKRYKPHMRILQDVLLCTTNLDRLRYRIPAMSMSWNASVIIERNGTVHSCGSVPKPIIPASLRLSGCCAGDSYFAFLSCSGEVWVSGHLESSGGTAAVTDPQILRGVSSRTKMICGASSRLSSLTTAHTVRPLSAIPVNSKNLVPHRPCKYICCGIGEEVYAVGFDNALYKTSVSQRALGTPRRMMAMSRIAVSRIAAGSRFVGIIDVNGRLYTTGRNTRGQLGNGKKQDSMRKPHLHEEMFQHYFTAVGAGDTHLLVLTSDGDVYGCGSNDHGQLGLGSDLKESLILRKIPLKARCVDICAGPMGSMFALANGKVYCCGSNDCNQLGVDSSARVVLAPTRRAKVENGVQCDVLGEISQKPVSLPASPHAYSATPPPPHSEGGGGGSTSATGGKKQPPTCKCCVVS